MVNKSKFIIKTIIGNVKDEYRFDGLGVIFRESEIEYDLFREIGVEKIVLYEISQKETKEIEFTDWYQFKTLIDDVIIGVSRIKQYPFNHIVLFSLDAFKKSGSVFLGNRKSSSLYTLKYINKNPLWCMQNTSFSFNTQLIDLIPRDILEEIPCRRLNLERLDEILPIIVNEGVMEKFKILGVLPLKRCRGVTFSMDCEKLVIAISYDYDKIVYFDSEYKVKLEYLIKKRLKQYFKNAEYVLSDEVRIRLKGEDKEKFLERYTVVTNFADTVQYLKDFFKK